ncbi:MAG TPA: penicillin acylase family protein, partial [Solirubrobacteraceae bacterium]|nr:penicillin acylase family protein [Solirubrobacteraceae bacterium]
MSPSRPVAALLAAVASFVLAAAPAAGRTVQAGSVLPPGQSGFLGAGGPSPHLTDQLGLFNAFELKAADLNRGGTTEQPRPGVTIARDAYGVPAITGTTDEDAWFGVGYAVAQDRLTELELFRRQVQGRLAAILGEDRLQDDIVARRDFYTRSELDAMVATLPAALRARQQAYADGINAWLQRALADPALTPQEFTLLNLTPGRWTTTDLAAMEVQLARTVPSGDGNELGNARALRSMGPRRFDRLVPVHSPQPVVTVPRSAGLFPSQPGRTRAQERSAYRRSQAFLGALPLPPASAGLAVARRARGGSNAYAVRGRGRAYLNNSPQLGFSIPEVF